MRSLIVKSAMAGAVLLLASGTARASDVLQVNVPFSFQVGTALFPAGRYMVEEDSLHGRAVFLIRAMQTPQAAFVLTEAAAGQGRGQPSLQFDHRENQYRLTGVWEAPGDGRTIVMHR